MQTHEIALLGHSAHAPLGVSNSTITGFTILLAGLAIVGTTVTLIVRKRK